LLSRRLAKEFPVVRLRNPAIPPGLWQLIVQLAVKIGWTCVENETVAAAPGGGGLLPSPPPQAASARVAAQRVMKR
jgi:hypothetical protein